MATNGSVAIWAFGTARSFVALLFVGDSSSDDGSVTMPIGGPIEAGGVKATGKVRFPPTVDSIVVERIGGRRVLGEALWIRQLSPLHFLVGVGDLSSAGLCGCDFAAGTTTELGSDGGPISAVGVAAISW